MQKLTWKKGIALAILLLAGCCDTNNDYDFPIINPDTKTNPANDMDIRAIMGGDL